MGRGPFLFSCLFLLCFLLLRFFRLSGRGLYRDFRLRILDFGLKRGSLLAGWRLFRHRLYRDWRGGFINLQGLGDLFRQVSQDFVIGNRALQFIQLPGFRFETLLDLLSRLLELPHCLAKGPGQLGQFIGSENDQSNRCNNQQLRQSNIKHRSSLENFYTIILMPVAMDGFFSNL